MSGSTIWDEVRNTLDGLGYRELLPHNSLPLVQRLLTDLIRASKELNETSQQLSVKSKVSSNMYCI